MENLHDNMIKRLQLRQSVAHLRVVKSTPENLRRLGDYASQTFFNKVKHYLSVVSGPKVDDTTAEKRLIICRTINDGEPCRFLRKTKDGEWCGACGCGYKKAAELAVKLKWAKVECPAGHFDAEE